MNTKIMFSSQNMKWRTPKAIYNELNEIYNFDFDPCPDNASFDGLSVEWKKKNFVNPPYGREIKKWVKKGIMEHKKGKLVVFLVASRTDTTWFHDLMKHASEVIFLKGRLKFSEYKNSAPFPSAIVIMSENMQKRTEENK